MLPTRKIARRIRIAALKQVPRRVLLNRMLERMAQSASISITAPGSFGARSVASTRGHTWWILILMAAGSGRMRILKILLIKPTVMPNTVEYHTGRRHHFHCSMHANSTAQNLAILFNFFNFSRCCSFVTIYSSFLNRPSLVASYAVSDPPGPLFTNILSGRCHIHRCRNILPFGEEILAFRNSALAPVHQPPTPPMS